MKHTRILAATAIATLLASGAMATTVEIDFVRGDWQNVTGDAFGHEIDNSDSFSSVTWPANDQQGNFGQSGYDFERADLSIFPNPGDQFVVGTFTHRNQVIRSGSGIDTVELKLDIRGMVGDTAFSLTPTFFMDHDETPNSGTCPRPEGSQPHTTVCDDFVDISLLSGSLSTTVAKGLERHTFTLLGFSTDEGLSFNPLFQSPEGTNNPSELFMSYNLTVIPLPAAGWLLLGGLGALGAMARRRRKAA